MSWSLGEVRALALKAARGAGLDWGHAEELSQTVIVLHQNGFCGVDFLASWLEWREAGSDTAAVDDVPSLGASMLDMGDWQVELPEHISDPALLAAYVALVAGEETLALSWSEGRLLIGKDRIYSENSVVSPSQRPTAFSLTLGDQTIPDHPMRSRVNESAASGMAALGRFAARTYAPSTEQSRAAGAGAGDDGND